MNTLLIFLVQIAIKSTDNIIEPVKLKGQVSSSNSLLFAHFDIFQGGRGGAGYHQLSTQFDFNYSEILFTGKKVDQRGVNCRKSQYCKMFKTVQFTKDNLSNNMLRVNKAFMTLFLTSEDYGQIPEQYLKI